MRYLILPILLLAGCRTDFSDIVTDFHSHFIPNSLPNNVRGPKKRKPIRKVIVAL